MTALQQLAGYLPAVAHLCGEQSSLTWLRMERADMSEPFFLKTALRIARSSPERVSSTHLRALLPFADAPVESQYIFVFHTSRCGSTVLANAAKTIRDGLVISEPPVVSPLLTPVGSDLWPRACRSAEVRDALIKGAVHAFARSGLPCRYLLVKFGAMAALQIPLFRRLFPTASFLFLYRDPREVIASNIMCAPSWWRSRSLSPFVDEWLGSYASAESLSDAQFWSRSFAEFCRNALAAKMPSLHYGDLTADGLLQAFRAAGVSDMDLDESAVGSAAAGYSKGGGEAFSAADDARRLQAARGRIAPQEIELALQAYNAVRRESPHVVG
jgi:hypothetical protein